MADDDEPRMLKFKIVIMGDEAVGKTSLIHQFVHEVHNPAYKPTVGCDFYTKVVRCNDHYKINCRS